MIIKKFYSGDTTKRIWRKKIVEFINENYSKKQLKNAKVLCFPGHEMLEIFEIYDLLGVQRRNIFGIEGNPFVFEKLNSKNNQLKEKIKVINSSLKEYLESNKKTEVFDIVILDYTSYFDYEKSKILSLFAQKRLLGGNPIIITNYPQGRTTNYLQKNMLFVKKHQILKNDLFSIFRNKQEIEGSESYSPMQDKVIQLNPINCLLEGAGIWNSEIFKKWEKTRLNLLNKNNKKRFIKIIKLLRQGDDYSEELINYLFFSKENLQLQNINIQNIFSSLSPYFPETHKSYKYISESGSTMISDFYFFTKYDSNEDYIKRIMEISENFPKKRIEID